MTETTNRTVKVRYAHPRWIQLTVLLVVFISGGFVGATIAMKCVHSRMEYLRANPDALPNVVLPRLRRILTLTAEQSTEIHAIISRHHPQIDSYRRQGIDGMHNEFDVMEKEVAAVLDDVRMSSPPVAQAPLFSDEWYRVKSLKPRLADDVIAERHQYRGQLWWVLHRPSTRSVHRLDRYL